MDLTVVIPSYGLDALLQACLTQLEVSIARAELGPSTIVVVDNGSPSPYRVQQFDCQGLQIVRTDGRVSFSRASNAGAAAAPAAHYLFLNNDVLLHPRALGEMMHLIAAPNVGLCGTRMVFPDQTIQHCGVRMTDDDAFARHEFYGRTSRSVPRNIRSFQAVTGAALAVRGDLFVSLGGFDESYPFGYEDVDLCLRARLAGWTVACAQSFDSIHFESTSNKDPDRHQASRKVFAARWAGRLTVDFPCED